MHRAISTRSEACARSGIGGLVAARSARSQRSGSASVTKPKASASLTSRRRARATCWWCPRSATAPYRQGLGPSAQSRALSAARCRQSPSPARGVPLFKGKQTIVLRMAAPTDSRSTTRCGPARITLSDPHPDAAVLGGVVGSAAARGQARRHARPRRDDLISKDANPADVAADRANYDRVARTPRGGPGHRQHRVDARADRDRAVGGMQPATPIRSPSKTPASASFVRQASGSARWSTRCSRRCRSARRRMKWTSSPGAAREVVRGARR